MFHFVFIPAFGRSTFYELSLNPGGYVILFIPPHLGILFIQELDLIFTRKTPGEWVKQVFFGKASLQITNTLHTSLQQFCQQTIQWSWDFLVHLMITVREGSTALEYWCIRKEVLLLRPIMTPKADQQDIRLSETMRLVVSFLSINMNHQWSV